MGWWGVPASRGLEFNQTVTCPQPAAPFGFGPANASDWTAASDSGSPWVLGRRPHRAVGRMTWPRWRLTGRAGPAGSGDADNQADGDARPGARGWGRRGAWQGGASSPCRDLGAAVRPSVTQFPHQTKRVLIAASKGRAWGRT